MSAAERVRAAYRRIAEADRPEVWIALRPEADAVADAVEGLPLSGLTVAVKDNVDVAGLETTAACPAFAYTPAVSAPAVARLVAAGAVVLGKTNLDQFATGLTGTRSPYGAVRDARRPEYVSGGSSSGSAVAVALGMADIGVATDTAGSGRVPAAFQGIVGVKPTYGLITLEGVVPACRSLDCVAVFARDLATAEHALAVMIGPEPERPRPADAPLGARPRPRVAIPRELASHGLSPAVAGAFASAAARLVEAGAELVEIDIAPLLEAGRMLYGGAFVAERHAAVGAFVDAHRGDVDPVVGEIIAAAGRISASALAADQAHLATLRRQAAAALAQTDVLLLPTAPFQPTIAEVAADPVGVNARLGIYTTFCNLLDLCAVAVPPGVTVFAPAFGDRVAADVARLLTGGPEPDVHEGVELLVVGAHRAGQPLNHQLTELGARRLRTVHTAPEYRLHRLDTEPPKPGLVRGGDAAVEGELWALPRAGLGTFLAALPAPMALGRVRLEGGGETVGFLCEPAALDGAEDISSYGSWPAYLAAQARAVVDR